MRPKVCRVCRVVQGWFFRPNTPTARESRALYGSVQGVQGCRARRRACTQNFKTTHSGQLFFYARTEQPYTPCTPCTDRFNRLIYKSFICVGFVLGFGFLCWVDVLLGAW